MSYSCAIIAETFFVRCIIGMVFSALFWILNIWYGIFSGDTKAEGLFIFSNMSFSSSSSVLCSSFQMLNGRHFSGLAMGWVLWFRKYGFLRPKYVLFAYSIDYTFPLSNNPVKFAGNIAKLSPASDIRSKTPTDTKVSLQSSRMKLPLTTKTPVCIMHERSCISVFNAPSIFSGSLDP